MSDDGLREHYLRALHLLRDMFEQLAIEHVATAPEPVAFQVPRDVVVGWRTRAAALPLDEVVVSGATDQGKRPWLVGGERDAGPWEHDDGSPCAVFLAPRPYPAGLDSAWWCTEHQQHLHPAAPIETRRQTNSGDTAEEVALLRLLLPLPLELVTAVMGSVSNAVEPLGYTAHIGPDAQLIARRPQVGS